MKEEEFAKYIGKTKDEIKKELGHECNYFPSDVWTYCLKEYGWGIRKILILYFQNDKVIKVKTKKIYGKIKTRKL